MTQTPPPCTGAESSQFDFWLGDWDLTWPAEQTGGTAGETGRGTNRIQRLFGNCAVEENFQTEDGEFKGRSVSVYDPRDALWRQTWVDNMGSYLLFTGGLDGENMELRTAAVERDGDTVLNRMVFIEIQTNGFRWEWQGSRDGAESWADLWTITYNRTT